MYLLIGTLSFATMEQVIEEKLAVLEKEEMDFADKAEKLIRDMRESEERWKELEPRFDKSMEDLEHAVATTKALFGGDAESDDEEECVLHSSFSSMESSSEYFEKPLKAMTTTRHMNFFSKGDLDKFATEQKWGDCVNALEAFTKAQKAERFNKGDRTISGLLKIAKYRLDSSFVALKKSCAEYDEVAD